MLIGSGGTIATASAIGGRPPAIDAFHFTSGGHFLFGCYRVPRPGAARGWGAVMCYPTGHEYIHSHRACRQLEAHLLSSGFHVLRFDYYGCGDSEGDGEQARLGDWLADTASAIDQLRLRSPSIKVCLVGLRLGAALAMLAASRERKVDALVLWDPVVDGRAHVEQLRSRHALREQSARAGRTDRDPDSPGSEAVEILGFLHSQEMVSDLSRLNLLETQGKPAPRALLVDGGQTATSEDLRKHFNTLQTPVDYRHIPAPQPWDRELYELVMPTPVLQAITSWMSTACA